MIRHYSRSWRQGQRIHRESSNSTATDRSDREVAKKSARDAVSTVSSQEFCATSSIERATAGFLFILNAIAYIALKIPSECACVSEYVPRNARYGRRF